MAKKAAAGKPARHKKLAQITGISRQIVDHVINAAVFGQYPECCALDDLAKEFRRQPARFRPTIKRLVEEGYLELVGLAEMVYPTVVALRNQDRELNQADAEKMVRQLNRTR